VGGGRGWRGEIAELKGDWEALTQMVSGWGAGGGGVR